MESIVLNVKDLEAAERRRYETVLGQQLDESQRIILMVVSASVEPSSAQRDQAWADIQQLSKKAQENMQKTGTTPEEWEALVDECL